MFLVLIGGCLDFSPDPPSNSINHFCSLNCIQYTATSLNSTFVNGTYRDYGQWNKTDHILSIPDVTDLMQILSSFVVHVMDFIVNIGLLSDNNQSLWLLSIRVQVRFYHHEAGLKRVLRECRVSPRSSTCVTGLGFMLKTVWFLTSIIGYYITLYITSIHDLT